ncbi:P-selectin isoform X2 [Ictidomys tridecemlineatus]|uniref:P-selectin isoform X2 n=1 Tax=Ictidomys tridecemlineatus TaxID=43179 RepID=UPI000B546145|nr:P-selectin isoform X2 [Ictidomys tridecemlineatus]KAG3258780.1 selectin P, transcript variant X2 [Ictidomys tridecemlineatus]
MDSCLKAIWILRSQRVVFGAAQLLWFGALISELTNQKEVTAWTYNYSIKAYPWNYSRAFCQKHFTDLVAIQNKNEIAHLNEVIPYYSSYYWIGIRKINNKWTWVGTKKALTEEAENWADNEPNNKRNNQDCVEIYIKSLSAPGKWNDEPCGKRKRALCYTASCHDMSCSKQGDCIETIGNYTCSCHPGFHGPECEYAVQCQHLEAPDNGTMDCVHPLAAFAYGSRCSFECQPGYRIRGLDTLHCIGPGQWTAPLPTCEALACEPLESPDHGSMECSPSSRAFQYNSRCSFHCTEGFLLRGADVVWCADLGQWTAPAPMCQAVQCQDLPAPHRAQVNCSHPSGSFRYQSVCSFTCEEGSLLVGEGELRCLATGHWSAAPPECQAVTCSPLLSPQNGTMTCTRPFGESSYKATCQFICEEGFSLSGPERLDCTPSGQWTGSPPRCEGIASVSTSKVQCPALVASGQGTMTCRHTGENFGLDTTCYFGCKAGFTLTGDSTLKCNPSGQWTAVTPACRAIKCPELHINKPTVMNCSNPWGNFSYGSTCTFHCPEGHLLNGSARAACQENGHWSATTPTCQEGPLTVQEALTYFGGAVASTIGLVMGGTLLALLRKRLRKKDDGKCPLNPQSHLGTYGVFTNAAFDPNP